MLWTLLYVTGYTAWQQDAPGMGDDRASGPPNPIGMTIPVFARTADGFLGMTEEGRPGRSGAARDTGEGRRERDQASEQPAAPQIPQPIELLKGIFGR